MPFIWARFLQEQDWFSNIVAELSSLAPKGNRSRNFAWLELDMAYMIQLQLLQGHLRCGIPNHTPCLKEEISYSLRRMNGLCQHKTFIYIVSVTHAPHMGSRCAAATHHP